MGVREQIAKLESLLATVRRNRGQARALTSTEAQVTEPAVRAAIGEVADDGAPLSTPPPVVLTGRPPGKTPAPVETLEVLDDDIVELPPEDVAVAEPPLAPPAASVNGSETARKIPFKTPRPESENQEQVGPPPEAELEGGDAVDELLEADLSGAPISLPSSASQPTMSQLGETVELEGADAPPTDLELADASESADPAASQDDMEVSLPRGAFAGGYDATLEPPPGAREELEQHQRAQESGVVNIRPSERSPITRPTAVTERTPLPSSGHVAEIVRSRPLSKEVPTFLALLDTSLRLGE